MQTAQRRTPGVYVTELSAFPPSVVGVPTAIPAFVGYTEFTNKGGKDVRLKPVLIGSLAEFEETFGTDSPTKRQLVSIDKADPKNPYTWSGESSDGNISYYNLVPSRPRYCLYRSLKLFYANGGGTCYIVSVNSYAPDSEANSVKKSDLQAGLDAIHDQVGPTILVIPDAILLPADEPPTKNSSSTTSNSPQTDSSPPTSVDFDEVVTKMLNQCGELGDRVAILDIYGSDTLAASDSLKMPSLIDNFRRTVGTEHLNYGMAYFPCLRTSIVDVSDMSLANFDFDDPSTLPALQDILTAQARSLYETTGQFAELVKSIGNIGDSFKAAAVPLPLPPDNPDPANPSTDYKAWEKKKADRLDWPALNKNLPAKLPVLKQIYALLAAELNILPSSAAIAGVYTYIDSVRGVWNAPANVSLNAVSGPTFKVNSAMQEDLNVPLNGKAVNAIRDFVGQGTLVWGARTLDGNSNDYRYIQVRRTLIYVEQSIKAALNQFVFAPNDAQTWVTAVAMISNFLTTLWTQGGLMGAKASEAFSVQCGLGSTMTGNDVLTGYMRVQVALQMIHPAEFIELTFTQKMQGVG